MDTKEKLDDLLSMNFIQQDEYDTRLGAISGQTVPSKQEVFVPPSSIQHSTQVAAPIYNTNCKFTSEKTFDERREMASTFLKKYPGKVLLIVTNTTNESYRKLLVDDRSAAKVWARQSKLPAGTHFTCKFETVDPETLAINLRKEKADEDGFVYLFY
eukprot:TRINITY_DN6460_c0_g1_i1.p1 TRINITY_DN6460_c0_g1~~TRINITY_DN6460_c0_g1_i1.p1  ORF type:complete len:157 (+),score=22.88 TRINITY_DN6460_c0_g1_i1:69-539(+)